MSQERHCRVTAIRNLECRSSKNHEVHPGNSQGEQPSSYMGKAIRRSRLGRRQLRWKRASRRPSYELRARQIDAAAHPGGGIPQPARCWWMARTSSSRPNQTRIFLAGRSGRSTVLNQIPSLNQEENITLPCCWRAPPGRARQTRRDTLVNRIGPGPAEPIGRAAAARLYRTGVINNPALVLADEPTGNLE